MGLSPIMQIMLCLKPIQIYKQELLSIGFAFLKCFFHFPLYLTSNLAYNY